MPSHPAPSRGCFFDDGGVSRGGFFDDGGVSRGDFFDVGGVSLRLLRGCVGGVGAASTSAGAPVDAASTFAGVPADAASSSAGAPADAASTSAGVPVDVASTSAGGACGCCFEPSTSAGVPAEAASTSAVGLRTRLDPSSAGLLRLLHFPHAAADLIHTRFSRAHGASSPFWRPPLAQLGLLQHLM